MSDESEIEMSKPESPGDEEESETRYTVRYRQPKGWGGQWEEKRQVITCDRVEVTGKIVRFIAGGEDILAINEEHLIGYERGHRFP